MTMDTRTKKRYAAYAAAIVLSVLAFSPLVIPSGEADPRLFGMPRTLWAGVLVTAALVFVTYLAGRFAPSDDDAPGDDPDSAPHPPEAK